MQAIADTLLRLGWTYVSVIHSDSQDDTSSMESFKKAAAQSNICISKTESIPSNANSGDIGNAILDLIFTNGPKVVVIFATTSQASQMLGWIGNTLSGQVQWVFGQHAMSDTSALDALPSTITRGIIGVIPEDLVASPEDNFLSYFRSQRPSSVNLDENPWFEEFWMEAYQCNLNGATKYPIPCGTQAEQSHSNAKLYPHTRLVNDAVGNFLRGIGAAKDAKCGSGTSGICDAFRNMAPSEFLDFIRGAGYKPNGDPSPVKFAVQNFKSSTSGYAMSTVSTYAAR